MVKLDVSLLRFLEEEDFRVLTALEMTMRNHDVAPTVLVERIAQLNHGGTRKRLMMLLKHKLIHHENTMYDGYAMKYGAYDYLALHTFSKRGSVVGVAHRIGCGKESDIILVHDENGRECVLKLQRLGRCSFRSVTRNRDYKGGGKSRRGESWFYLSRLASQKEYSFMKALYDEGFPVPKPIDQNRHALVMELVPGTLLNNIIELGDPEKVYRRCLDLMIKLGEAGLIHGDFNEFNLMITEEQQVIMIDFPQMVSINHKNAEELFNRDVENLANFFTRRFKIAITYFPTLEKDVTRKSNLDHQVFASGHFTKKLQENLEKLMEQRFEEMAREAAEGSDGGSSDSEEEDSADEEQEEQEELEEAGEGEAHNNDNKNNKGQSNEKESSSKRAKRAVHFDPIDGPAPQRRRSPPEDNDVEEEDEEDEEDDNVSLDEAVEDAKKDRRAAAALLNKDKPNANFLPDGEINEDHLKKQVRKNIQRKDMQNFYRSLHRNTQKGRQKQTIQRQVKNASADSGFYD